PPDWIARVCQRMLTLCTAANSADHPDLATCAGYLLARDDAETAPLLDALTSGAWDIAWRTLSTLAGRPHQPLIDQVMTRYRAATSGSLPPERLRRQPVEQLKTHWQERGARLAIALLARLHRRQRLDGTTFRQLLETLPGSLGFVNQALLNRSDNLSDE